MNPRQAASTSGRTNGIRADVSRRAFLALGSNVGNREQYLRDAVARLASATGVNFLRASSVYETEPVGIADQPRFLNMVIEIEVEDRVTTRDLLSLAKRIESDLGRVRREKWGPREIDIDLLLVGEEKADEADLKLPHPEMWERAFVVVPLAELAPELRAPSGESAAQVAERLRREQGIHGQIRL